MDLHLSVEDYMGLVRLTEGHIKDGWKDRELARLIR
jgi:hypothetical protein